MKMTETSGHRLSNAGADAPDNLADALDTLDRVRDALTKIDRLENAWALWKPDYNQYERGRSDAYRHAHTIITRALGDTP